MEKLPSDLDAEEAALKGVQKVLERINAGETGLFDPTNNGDGLALALAGM